MRPTAVKSSLATIVALAFVLTGCSDTDPESGTPPAEGSPTASPGTSSSVEPASTKGWRAEAWHDLQLKVPADWTVGYGPVTQDDEVLECGVGPVGSDGPDTTTAYVGRPGYGSDVCDGTGEVEVPAQDFVWFGSPLEAGESGDEGRSVTTVEAGGEMVTVGAEPALAAAVVASIEEVAEDANGCPSGPVPETRYPAEGFGAPRALAVCVYHDDGTGAWQRTWTERLDADAAGDVVRAVALGKRAGCGTQVADLGDQRVMLRVEFANDFGAKPLLRDYVVQLGECPSAVDLSQGVIGKPVPVALSARVLDPWAGPGVEAYVVAGAVPDDLTSYFKPAMG